MKKQTVKISDWDPSEDIETKEDAIAYLEAALEENDTELLFAVIGDIAKSRSMTEIAKELKLNRESLYRSLSTEGNPSFNTLATVPYYASTAIFSWIRLLIIWAGVV
jgi:probable addiction module antidote protein